MMTILGVDWADIGKNAMGVVHTAGSIVLNVFGAGGAAKSLEQLEARAGILPDWAMTTPLKPKSPLSARVDNADYVVLVYKDAARQPDVVRGVSASVYGGGRFAGNGYRPGEAFGKKFSFGIDQPEAVEIVTRDGQKLSNVAVRQILFCGGNDNAQTKVMGLGGFDMSDKVLGDFIVSDIVGAPATVDRGDDDSSYLHGIDCIGAASAPVKKPRAGFVMKAAPKTGRIFTSFKTSHVKLGDHKSSIANAREAGARAIATADHIEAALRHMPPKGNLKKSAQIKRLANAARKAGKEALAQAGKHETKVAAAVAKRQTGQAAMKAKMASSTKFQAAALTKNKAKVSRVHGDDVLGAGEFDDLGRHGDRFPDDMNFEIAGDDFARDVLGVDDFELLNSAAAFDVLGDETYPATPPVTGDANDPTGEVATLGPPPTLEAVKAEYASTAQKDPAANANDQRVYHGGADDKGAGMPPGAVIYDGSHGTNVDAFGSWNHFFGRGDGFFYGRQGWRRYYNNGKDNDAAPKEYQGLGQAMLQKVANDSLNYRGSYYGPLIGNPKRPNDADWANGLRFNYDSGNFFWYYDQAPDWAIGPVYQELFSQRMADYRAALAAAQADNANSVAQDLLDAQQAKQLQTATTLQDMQIAKDQTAQAAQQEAFNQQYAQRQAQLEQDYAAQAAQLELRAQSQMFDEGGGEEYSENDGENDGSEEQYPSSEEEGGDPYGAEAEAFDEQFPQEGQVSEQDVESTLPEEG